MGLPFIWSTLPTRLKAQLQTLMSPCLHSHWLHKHCQAGHTTAVQGDTKAVQTTLNTSSKPDRQLRTGECSTRSTAGRAGAAHQGKLGFQGRGCGSRAVSGRQGMRIAPETLRPLRPCPLRSWCSARAAQPQSGWWRAWPSPALQAGRCMEGAWKVLALHAGWCLENGWKVCGPHRAAQVGRAVQGGTKAAQAAGAGLVPGPCAFGKATFPYN
jgi:hypothetical protein